MAIVKKLSKKDGNVYVPMEARSGEQSVVYFTRDLSPAGLNKAYAKVNEGIEGKVAVIPPPGAPMFCPSFPAVVAHTEGVAL